MSSASGLTPKVQHLQASTPHKHFLDTLHFGDSPSEASHNFTSEASTVIAGSGTKAIPEGADKILAGEPGEPGRVALPLEPPATRLADLRFILSVDPHRQNYLTVKFWGSDSSPYKTLVLVNGEQASYRTGGDYEPINVGTLGGLPGSFFHSTAALPLVTTTGQAKVEVTLRTYVLSYRTLADQTGFEKAENISRRFFSAATHTIAALPPSVLAPAPAKATPMWLDTAEPPHRPSREQETAIVHGFRQWQVDHFHALEAASDGGTPFPISKYDDDLRFYAEALLLDWSPATTPSARREGLRRIFAAIDHYTREYYGNVLLIGNGGHQSDWGGYYAALGEALYIVENLISDTGIFGADRFASFLDEPFSTGTRQGPTSIADAGWDGGTLTRRGAWERVLKANFDFARSRLSYIYNQVMYTYEGAWKAHEGLRVIGSTFYQGKARSHRIVREFLGIEPFLGEEVLAAPDGRDLNVHHSLFHHDLNAEYTEDYIQVIMKGLADSKLDGNGNQLRRKPYGSHYYGLTLAGLVRENGYVGVYGESTNYFPCWFFRTLDHHGDEELNDDILKVALKNLHARGFTRYQGRTANGRRIMYMQQVVDDRNSDYPGRPAYGTDEDSGAGLRYASLEQFMAQNEGRYAGSDWEEYREYAREATGYAQQQLADGQFFASFHRRWLDRKLKYDLRIQETYYYVTGGRAGLLGSTGAGRVLPHTHLAALTAVERQELGLDDSWDNTSFAWVDIDNLLVSARDGHTHVFANLLERNTGLSGASRAHLQHDGTEQLLQFQADADMTHGYVAIRGQTREEYRQKAADEVIEGRPFALTGELLPVAALPGVGCVDRDNFVEDNPYSAYPDLATAWLGEYYIAINTTRPSYRNACPMPVTLPEEYPGDTVQDLVTGTWLPLTEGQLILDPLSAVVLKVGAESPNSARIPAQVPAIIATPGPGQIGLSWKPVAGASAYTITRTLAGYEPETIRTGIVSTSAIFDADQQEASYSVIATNSSGPGRPSQPARETALPYTGPSRLASALIGPATNAHISQARQLQFTEVAAAGFAEGDDANLYQRGRPDSLAAATVLVNGSMQVTAQVNSAAATAGLILRENLKDVERYVFLGFDGGSLVLRTRTLDTREDYGAGNPGEDAGGGTTRSPYSLNLGPADPEAWPWLRLQRDAEGHKITALISTDGDHWHRIAQDIVPMLPIVHAGLCVTGDAEFSGICIDELDTGRPLLTAAYSGANVELAWTKPRKAYLFDVHVIDETGTGVIVAQDLPRTSLCVPATSWLKTYKVIAKDVDGGTYGSAELTVAPPPAGQPG